VKLFIDECLSNELTRIAIGRGYGESSSVTFRGLGGTKDWDLVPIVVAEDFTLVTKNSVDFRGRANAPGGKGLYKDLGIHAGLICLNGPVGMDLDMQVELFEVALDELERIGRDLINKCLEVTVVDAEIEVVIYELPKA
jgi:hypothetical protein